MNKHTLHLTAALLLLLLQHTHAQRSTIDLRTWQFSRDSVTWSEVRIPHDWAISGPFDKKWDLQHVAIEQNGETEATEKSGRSGALPWIGHGYYRTQVDLPDNYGHALLHFDGAMAEPQVRINGTLAGHWVYGYNAFQIDATPYLKPGQPNTIEVSLRNLEESSRWYPGGGLYRPVTLTLTPEQHITQWGTYVRTLTAQGEGLTAQIQADIQVQGIEHTPATILHTLTDAQGHTVAQSQSPTDHIGQATSTLDLPEAHLWSPETPYLYTLTTQLIIQGKIIDQTTTKVGIRTITIDRHGFSLNGKPRKIQGVCLHHDLGPLGAAVNRAALIRQIRILKDMGCDAIRTAHNMPSTIQMEVCDSMGMMVMAESFDMWLYPKCRNGYALHFRDWAERDIRNLILNHRNHPSIIMWSIGNEIPEQWSIEGRQISRHLQNLCHQLDPTRPVTQGMDRAEDALRSGFARVMDIAGFNYRVHKYDDNIAALPSGILLGSETASTVSSRGVYDPSCTSPREVTPITDPNSPLQGQCTSYDTDYPEVELFLNGRSLGRQKKQAYTIAPGPADKLKPQTESPQLLRRYRLIWDSITYVPGTLRAVAYDAQGRRAMERTLRTAGSPSRLTLQPDRTTLRADGDDLSFITVSLVDSRGTLCPDADDKVEFTVAGSGTLRGLCNGDATSLESFTGDAMHLFHGQLVLVVQSTTTPGTITITARTGKKQTSTEIKVVR